MNFSKIFIQRPVATLLLSVAIILVGLVGWFLLPIAALPDMDFPAITITAALPGASPKVMASTVATPLERSLGTIAGITEMNSRSSLGQTRIVIEFDLDRDINEAANDVQAAINAARNLLPTDMPSMPTYDKVNSSSAPMIILTLSSDVLTQAKLYDLASSIVAQKISQIDGVGDSTANGSSLPAVRIELEPAALNSYGIALDDIRSTILAANLKRPQGAIDEEKQYWQIQASDQLNTAEDYKPLIIRHHNGKITRLSDVATVIDSTESRYGNGFFNKKSADLVVIKRETGANIIETVNAIKAILPELRSLLPKTVKLGIATDRTGSIRSTLHEAERTLAIAIILVVLVIYLFLGSWRAALIPTLAIPISLIGTLPVIYFLGFSLNNLSLMALILATGLVVDDAIVVLENITRHIDSGLKPMQAAYKGMQDIGFTLLSINLSLIAVFVSVLFIGGFVERLFREFSITLVVAIVISLMVSLTLTPTLCAYFLPNKTSKKPVKKYRWQQRLDSLGLRVICFYEKTLNWSLNHGKSILFIFFSCILLSILLFIHVPKALMPQQDTGQVIGFLRGDKSVSYQAMQPKIKQYRDSILQNPSVKSVAGFIGGRGGLTNSFLILRLKSRSERNLGVTEIINQLKKNFPKVPGAQLVLVPDQDLHVGKSQGGSSDNEYLLLSSDVDLLMKWLPKVANAFRELPELTDIDANGLGGTLQQKLIVNRSKAKKLGIDMSLVTGLLDNSFSERQISTIYKKSNEYQVVMELSHKYTQSEKILQQLKVITDEGTVVPLASFSHWESGLESDAVMHRGQFAAENIGFSLAKGVSLNQGINAIEKTIADLNLPIEIRGELGGTSALFKQTQSSQSWMILLAIGAVYLVLGVLYESYIHPITILSTLPSAGLGALVALEVFKSEFTLISLLGLFFLIGLVKKNAILMVDAALEFERNGNISPKEAIKKACLLRFRPILMTTLSALLGALPLVLSNADGSEIYKPLGITVIGGLIMSQFLTLYSTPVIYVYFDRMATRFSRKQNKASKVSI